MLRAPDFRVHPVVNLPVLRSNVPFELVLECKRGPNQGTSFAFRLDTDVTFGRDGDADKSGTRPTDPGMHRRHVVFSLYGGEIRMKAIQGAKSLLVNGRPARKATLVSGDRLVIGRSHLLVHLEELPGTKAEQAKVPDAPKAELSKAQDVRAPVASAPVAPTPKSAPEPPVVTSPPAEPPQVAATPPPSSTGSFQNIEERRLDDLHLGDQIGVGAMGRVFEAWDPDTNEKLCVKTIRAAGPRATKAVDMFWREINLLAGMDHPNIIRFLYAGGGRAQQFYAMEWIDGHTLEHEITTGGPLNQMQACALARQLLSALSYAHAKATIHRDINPRNIMLRGPRNAALVTLIDFGLGKRLKGESGGSNTITETGEMRGSLGFASKECLLDAKRAVPASDLFSVSATLYYALSGKTYFPERKDNLSIYQLIGGEHVVPLSERGIDIHPAFEAWIEQGLATDPHARWPTADDMLTALLRVESEMLLAGLEED